LSKYELHCPTHVKIIKFLVIWHHFDNFYVKKWSKNPLPSLCVMSSKKSLHVSYKITTLSWFGYSSTPVESLPNLNPAFLLSTSRPFNRWPSVWFGSMLCGISMRLHGLEGDFQWW
jgi:hypothetical protein